MKNKTKKIGIIAIIAIIGLSMAACASSPSGTSANRASAGVISFEIDSALRQLWTGTDFDVNGNTVGGFNTKTIQFTADSIEGSSDVVFEINVILNEMAKAGDAKLIARAGVIRFTGNFQGTDMSDIPQWFTYTIGDGGYALTIRDIPSRKNNQTTPELFSGDRPLN